MPFVRLSKSNKTFARRWIEMELLFGLPMTGLELCLTPFRYWTSALVIVIPSTIVGLTIVALLEHVVFRFLRGRKAKSDDSDRSR